MSRGTTGPMFHHGFGPSWDQMFVQSNYGVVTKMGMWLMPAPEATLSMSMKLPDPEDLGWLVDVLAPLRLRGIVNHNVSVQGCMASATMSSQRKDWYQGDGALPDSVLRAIMAKHDVGWWNFTLRLYGDPEVNEANARLIQKAFAARTTLPFTIARWSRAESGTIGGPAPGVFPLQIVNWHGGRGGHIGFSPVLPPDGKLVVEQLRLTRQRFREAGVDYSGTFYISGRHVINVNLIIYDRDNAAMTQRVRGLFAALVKDSAAAGYAEYRTHLSYMDEVAATFDFNGHALRRLNETVKDALDPNGILAPGRNGIWPTRYRGQRGMG
jgi:4-cresol dehydrogenase (hydroxylating)